MQHPPLDYERPPQQRPHIREHALLPKLTFSDMGRAERIVLGSFLFGGGLVTAFRYVQLTAAFGKVGLVLACTLLGSGIAVLLSARRVRNR
jgi:hypothetical protein